MDRERVSSFLNLGIQSALLGVAFALAAAALFVFYFRFALSRQRSPYLLLLGNLAVLLVAGPFAIAQLATIQSRVGITEPATRDVGFYIYVAALLLLVTFASRQIMAYNRRNRESPKPTI